jgi:hypothetical protein
MEPPRQGKEEHKLSKRIKKQRPDKYIVGTKADYKYRSMFV